MKHINKDPIGMVGRENKGMSKKTLKNIKSAMRAWLKFCRSKNYTALFVENIDIPKSAKTRKKRIL